MGCIITARPVEAQMTQDDVPIGEMKYSFKAYVQACGFPAISSLRAPRLAI